MWGASSRLFFVVSGEHPTLPRAELVAILETLAVPYRIVKMSYKLVEVESDPSRLEEVVRRGGFVDEAALELFHSTAEYEEIAEATRSLNLDRYLSKGDSFSVRVARFGEAADGVARVKLESLVGGLLARQSGAKVDLRNPTKTFRGVLTRNEFHLGQLIQARARGAVANRRPRKRPVFHPSTMVPKLARCMVNLAHASRGGLFLDPFCGVGGILIEACLVGSEVVGVDALPRMLRGARKNLSHFGFKPHGLIRGDARRLPIRTVDGIATDPPYGTGASTLRSTTRDILEDFLPQARNLLTSGKRTITSSPVGTVSPNLVENSGFTILDRHQMYVHRSLTREILVLGAT